MLVVPQTLATSCLPVAEYLSRHFEGGLSATVLASFFKIYLFHSLLPGSLVSGSREKIWLWTRVEESAALFLVESRWGACVIVAKRALKT